MKILALDIETIPSQTLPPNCVPVFDESEVKVGNMKDPAKIKEKVDEERRKFDEGRDKQMSLDPAFAQLCTFVGIQFDTETGNSIDRGSIGLQLTASDEHDDLELVGEAWTLITKMYHERTPIVTFNGLSFDLPVLLFRAIKQDFPLDRAMVQRLMGQKYRDNPFHYDLMQILANWDKNRWHSFDFYSRLFGLGDKEEFDGSKVYPAYKAGEYGKILEYCRKEVMIMCQLFTRVEAWIKNEYKEGV